MTVRSAVTESAWSGNRQTPALTVSGRRSEASNWSEWSTSIGPQPLEDVDHRGRPSPAGATTRNSSGP